MQRFFEDMWNAIANIPGRVWAVFTDKLREGLTWLWGHVGYNLVLYAIDVWLITDDWTRGWQDPWRTIARLFLFPAAFAFKSFRDYIGPALSNAINEAKRYFDGAFQAAADTLKSAFSPIVDPLINFANAVRDFIIRDLPNFLGKAADFFKDLPGRIADFFTWLKDEAWKSIEAIRDFFTKTLPDWLEKARSFLEDLPNKIVDFFTKELPEAVSNYLKRAWAWLDENVISKIRDAATNVWNTIVDSIRSFVRSAWEFFTSLPKIAEGEGPEAILVRMIEMVALGFTISIAVDLIGIKVMGTGLDLVAVKDRLKELFEAFFDIKMFTSIMMAIAVQKPLEHAMKRAFRTERPSPGDALEFLAKNIIDENEAMEYLAIAGYPDEIANKYIRSIYREPSFREVFVAYKRGKIDEREYNVWLRVLNIDKAELLDGTYHPYKVMEEAAYTLPSPFLIAQAIETGEVSEDVIKRILEYDLVHPEFIDIVAKALFWRAARDERSLLRRYVIDSFIEGAMKIEEFSHYLGLLGVSGALQSSIVEVADHARRKSIRRKALSYLEKQFLEGYMDRNDFVNQLVSYGYDEDLVREYATLLQYVRDNYIAVKETKDERSALKASLVNKYKRGLLSDEELEQELIKLNLNEIETALTVARAKLEFDAEQKEILFNDLIEKIKQGRLNKSEFVDQCTRLGIKYERCQAYANYYWSKYIGDEFYVITKDERSSLATALTKKYVMGFMTEEQLRQELKKLMYTDEEIELRIRRAIEEDEAKMLSDLLAEADNLLKKGEMTPEEYIEHLTSLGMRRERAEARARKILATIRKKK